MNIGAIYILYALVSVAMTVWVANTLRKNGRLFLVDAFRGNEGLADAVNHLLVVGFYLVNIGFMLLVLKTDYSMSTTRAALEIESWKLGFVIAVLGVMHMANIGLLALMRIGTRVLSRVHGGESA